MKYVLVFFFVDVLVKIVSYFTPRLLALIALVAIQRRLAL